MRITTAKTLVASFIVFASSSIAQVVTDFERVYYNVPEAIEKDDINLSTKNAVAQFDHSKLAFKIENESDDYIVYKPKETKFIFEFAEISPKLKELMVKPNGSKTKTLRADGGDKFLQEKFSLELGGLYRIPTDGEKSEPEDFKLPPAKNNFDVDDFEVVLKKYDASTREAKAEFECTYKGDKVALVNPANLSVRAMRKKSDEEVVYANDNKKSETTLLRKGEKVKFSAVFHIDGRIVDMQFATMHIVWNDTFVETTEIAIDSETFSFEMDEALTREKNVEKKKKK